jgi:hypothetical protein
MHSQVCRPLVVHNKLISRDEHHFKSITLLDIHHWSQNGLVHVLNPVLARNRQPSLPPGGMIHMGPTPKSHILVYCALEIKTLKLRLIKTSSFAFDRTSTTLTTLNLG